MSMWQISCKREPGEPMELLEFPNLWRVMIWLIRNLSGYRIAVIVRIEE